jgi:hypothetical protein
MYILHRLIPLAISVPCGALKGNILGFFSKIPVSVRFPAVGCRRQSFFPGTGLPAHPRSMERVCRASGKLAALQVLDKRFKSTQVVGQESKSCVQVFNLVLKGPLALLKLPLNRGNPAVQTANERRHLAR